MSNTAILEVNGEKHEFPLIVGTENEIGIDIKTLRGVSGGVITIDPGYKNTGACESGITFLNGESGYRSQYLSHAKRALYHLS